jgi:hypothetical protein
LRRTGAAVAWAVARRRRGRWFDPDLVDALGAIRRDRAFWAALARPDVSAWEPPERVLAVDEPRLDRIAEAFARVIDAKSPYTARHSGRVAELAVGTAAVLGFAAVGLRDLRRAALLHDIGKLAIANRILDKPVTRAPTAALRESDPGLPDDAFAVEHRIGVECR